MWFIFVTWAAAFSAALTAVLLWGRPLVVALAGLLVVPALMLTLAYLTSTAEPGECSDCSYVLGRWWEPGFSLLLSFPAWIAWALGAVAGALVAHSRASHA